MARFACFAELETFLGRLDPDYSDFASASSQNSVRTVRQLANAREPILLSCGLPELYIGDIKVRADRTGASSEYNRRQVRSSYTERLRNLPSASQMSQNVMR
ncbi:TPA: hypothetical protein ACH3X1_010913 [Trebouxia sp. C0004]